MDWQDELRTLDAKLAEGSLSRAEYRKLRDQVLAEASSGGPVHRPIVPEQRDQHHGPVHIPASAAEEEPSGEMTQVISADKTGDAAKTGQAVQTVPPPAEANADVDTDADADVDADRTVVVGATETSTPPPADSYQPPARTVPPPLPWETTHATPAPPVQGNEVFSVARKESSGKKAVLGALAALVVLAVIAAGVWFFVVRDDSQAEAGPSTPGPTAPGPSPDDIDARLPALQGVPDKNNSTMSLDKAQSLHLVFGGLKDLYHANGATEIVVHGYSDPGGATGVYVVPVTDHTKAAAVTDGVHDQLVNVGYKDAKAPLAAGVRVVERTDKQSRYLYASYTSGSDNVQISVLQPVSAAPAALTDRLHTAFTAVAKVLPVG